MSSSANSPTMCLGGCGFFGSPQTNGYCSQCFKHAVKSNTTTKNLNKSSSETDSLIQISSNSPSNTIPDSSSFGTPVKKKKKPRPLRPDGLPLQTKKTRCWICKKKIGLLGFECDCGYTFCSHHRYRDQHNCTVDPTEKRLTKLAEKYQVTTKKLDFE